MEKNKDKVSVWDAYRIYNGKGFLKSVLRTLLIGAVVLAAASVMLTIITILDAGDPTEFDVYFTAYASMTSPVILWFLILVKKLSSLDRSDKNAPGGKYFCTVKGKAATFAKAHILTTAESVFTVSIICLIDALGYMISYTDSIRKIAPSYQIPAEDIYYMLIVPWIYMCICTLLPLALSNFFELMPYRNHKSVVIITVFIAVPVILIALQVKIVNTAEFEAVTQIFGTLLWIILLIVSEYLIIKRKTADISDETVGTAALCR